MKIFMLLCLVFVQKFASTNAGPVTSEQKINRNEAEKYSEDEEECFSNRKFLFKGKCYSLLTQGPCPKGEWLVLKKSEVSNRPMKAICKKKPCKRSNEVWWNDTCVLKPWSKNGPCRGNGKTLILNYYGEGQCGCKDYHGEMKDENDCYEYYQQGPCEPNEVIIHDETSGYAICSRDKCLKENNAAGILKKYAPLNGIGKCYRLSSADPCESVGNYSRFVIDHILRIPTCSFRKLHLNLIDSPVLCRVDENKNCRSQVEVKSEDRLTFVLQMKKQNELDVKKNRNKTSEVNLNKTMILNEAVIHNATSIPKETPIRNATFMQNGTLTQNETLILNGTLIQQGTLIQNGTVSQNVPLSQKETSSHKETLSQNKTSSQISEKKGDALIQNSNATLTHNEIITVNATVISIEVTTRRIETSLYDNVTRIFDDTPEFVPYLVKNKTIIQNVITRHNDNIGKQSIYNQTVSNYTIYGDKKI